VFVEVMMGRGYGQAGNRAIRILRANQIRSRLSAGGVQSH
jgi:hypothetical protein